MFRKRGQETLKDEIERWLPVEKTVSNTKKKKLLKIFSFFLFLLVIWLFRGYMVYIEGFILLMSFCAELGNINPKNGNRICHLIVKSKIFSRLMLHQ